MTTRHPDALADYPLVDALPELSERPAAASLRERLRSADSPVMTVDDPVRSVSLARTGELYRRLAPAVDWIVAGEPASRRTVLSPSIRALLLHEAGATALMGVNGRDRNRVAIEGELAAFADIGIGGVLAVTGDPVAETSQASPVFDIDALTIAALARRAGMMAAVAVDPSPSRRAHELQRLRSKLAAGAECCFVNLAPGADQVAEVLSQAREEGTLLPAIACVPLVDGADAAQRLESLSGVSLPSGLLLDLRRGLPGAGIRAAVELGRSMLGVSGVVGLHWSPLSTGDPDGAAAIDLVLAVRSALESGEQ